MEITNKIKESGVDIISKIKDNTKRAIISNIINLATNLSDKNMIRIAYLAEKLMVNEKDKKTAEKLREMIKNKHPAMQVSKKINQMSINVKKKLINNFFVNACIIRKDIQSRIKQKEGWRPPFLFVVDITDRCNLYCEGCWAGTYAKEPDMSYELLNRILKEAKQLGIYFVTLTGGEPFIRKDILKIFEEHNDMFFQIYTNGTLITSKIAKKLAELGNVAPAISVEGFEKETDTRRGKGVHKKIMQAMNNLKKEGVLFGFSAMVTKNNSELVSSEEFIDFYINKGCCFGWYFQYVPIGRNPNINLMSTPKQRNELRKRVLKIRHSKPIFIGDFWNDGPFTKGCIAGAREGAGYFHITNKGDVEPCVFAHFSVDNIKNKSLKQVINSDFFKKIRKAQPYCENKNLLSPCMIIDHPQVLRNICKECGVKETQYRGGALIKDKKIIKFLDDYSKTYKKITNPLWEKEYAGWYEYWFGKKKI